MIRRRRVDNEGNVNRWLVSYADFVTLLFAFFVVLYAVSSVDLGKYRNLATSLGKAFQSEQQMKHKKSIDVVSEKKTQFQSNRLTWKWPCSVQSLQSSIKNNAGWKLKCVRTHYFLRVMWL